MQHIFVAMDKAQSIYLDTTKSPKEGRERFALQVEYIKNVVLDKDKQNQLQKRCDIERPKLIALYGKDAHEVDYRLGFIAINEVMRYLNDIMELEHHDTIGEVGISRDVKSINKMIDDEYGDLYE